MQIKNISLFLLGSSAASAASVERRAPPPKPQDPAKIMKALAGTYSLLNTSSTLNNVPIPDATYGEHPVGIITYSASGFMSATLTATEPEFRPAVTFPYQEGDSDADWALVGKHSIGYAGPYTVNTEIPFTTTEGQIFHGPLVVANVPTMQGAVHKRNYTVIERREEGKKVTYLRIGSERGGGYRGELWWKKLD